MCIRDSHNYDPKTDLYRHACDVSKRENWAEKTTGWSQHCWGRAMGWYAMACVDVLDLDVYKRQYVDTSRFI